MGLCTGLFTGVATWFASVALVATGSWSRVMGDVDADAAVLLAVLAGGLFGLHLGTFRSMLRVPRPFARFAALAPVVLVDVAVASGVQLDLERLTDDGDAMQQAIAQDDVVTFHALLAAENAALSPKDQRSFDLRDRPDLLRSAAHSGSEAVVASILAEASGVRACDGAAVLEVAIQNGHQDVLDTLIEGGVSVDAACGACRSQPALYLAAWTGDVRATESLLAAGADPECVGDDQATPLMRAAGNNHTDVVAVLIENGAQLDAHTPAGETALTLASNSGSLAAVELLLSRGAELEHREVVRTPLMVAAAGGHLHVVDHLLEAGALVDATVPGYQDRPERAVDLAERKGHSSVVERLLAAGSAPPVEG